MAKESKAFGSQRAKKAHLTLGKGGVAGEVNDLRNDVEEGFQNLEERVGFPELDYLVKLSGDPAAAGADFEVVGRNFLQGQTFDKINIVEGAADLLIECCVPGKSGISVIFETGAGALAVDLTDDVLTITLPVAGLDTVANIATAINADAANCRGILRANKDGAGNLTQAGVGTAAIPLAGGVGTYAENVVRVGGAAARMQNTTGDTTTAVWTDTSIKAFNVAVGAAGDTAQITVMSDGTRSDPLSVVLA